MLLKPSLPGARRRRRGFALITTVMMLALLALLGVGLLSLSSVTLRTTGQAVAMAEARANARLALTMAVGELQKHTGPDTRVTAPAELVSEESPPLLGVWRSWEGSNHEASGPFAGRPVAPDYGSKRKTSRENGRFLTWLVSGAGPEPRPGDAPSLVTAADGPDAVALVDTGTLGTDDDRRVRVATTAVGGSGGFAWWVSGENQKARIPETYKPEDRAPLDWATHLQSHPVADPEPFGLEALLDAPELARKAITLGSADLIGAPAEAPRARESFHDLSATSVGLLTNTATGGWRKDLSSLVEDWTRQPKSKLPFFRLTSDSSTRSSIPTTGSPVTAGSAFYPWAGYRGGNTIPIYQHAAVTSWANLVDFATHYQRISVGKGGRVTTPVHSENISGRENYRFLHKVRVLPVIARMQWVFSHSAQRINGGRNDGKYEPRLLLTPVITMWNPYNAEITAPQGLGFIVPKAIPAALRYTIGRVRNPRYNAVMQGVSNQPSLGGGALRFNIPSSFVLKPGETRLFSPQSTKPVADNANIALAPGYRNRGGHFFRVRNGSGQVVPLPGSTTLRADARFDTQENDLAIGVGMYLDMTLPGKGRQLVYRMVYTPEVANTVYPPITRLAGSTLAQCATNPQPFLSTIFGARTASNTHLAAKGFVQSSPFVNYTAMGRKDEVESTIRRHYNGSAHPVNSPFDYSFVKHAPGGDSQLPNAGDKTGRGYIVTGFNKSDGLSRCVIAELPLRPLASLGELTHWDLRFENPIPPYAINLIGNSDASPLLPADAVVNSRDAQLRVNLQHDDSYCANHLLFDDWFLSSISPDGKLPGTRGRDRKEVHLDFLNNEVPLANRAYQPIDADRSAAAAGNAERLHAEHLAPADAWKTIASRLEVTGMFNVNSTSVTAWRALLGHARGQRIPHFEETGGSWRVGLSDETDHALSRFTIAADKEAGTRGTSGAFPEATEFAGYRTVDDAFLDALAEQVVEQVRQRGPFLSLSEFINRQLTSSGDLALAGTLQAALDQLAAEEGADPFAKLKALSSLAKEDPPSPKGAVYDEEYAFPQAAAGHSAYGLPGWTRQVDILRPLAPILSARDDTFTIRSYGEARSSDGKILARAWCEATVRRTREFVDPADRADSFDGPESPLNQRFGRRFIIQSFRWLGANEV